MTPLGSGLYESTRELIMAQNKIGGLDSGIVDTLDVNGGKIDRGLESKSWDWAENADIFVMHSHVPKFLEKDVDAPIVMILHGTPEDCIYSELYMKDQFPYSTLLMYRKNKKKYKMYVTMWERDLDFWKPLFEGVRYVPAGVDLDVYKPEGMRIDFPGDPSIIFCDTWRNFKLPFACAYGVRKYYDTNPNLKFHVFDAPVNERQNAFWRTLFGVSGFKKFVGEFGHKVKNIERLYRGSDMLVTGVHSGPSRVIREATACGLTVVAGGVAELEFNAHPNKPSEYAKQLKLCWDYIQDIGKDNIIAENRKRAEKYFDVRKTAAGMKDVYVETHEKYGKK